MTDMRTAAPVTTHRHQHGGVLDLGWERFGQLCARLVENIARDFRPDAVVGVAKGGVLPGVVVSSALFVDFYPIKLSSRRNEEVVRSIPQVFTPPPVQVAGRRVLLVDDISVTFRTLDMATELVRQAGAAEVRTATLAVHGSSRKPDWYAVESDNVILLPWDRNVFRAGTWSMNPEYADEIERLEQGH